MMRQKSETPQADGTAAGPEATAPPVATPPVRNPVRRVFQRELAALLIDLDHFASAANRLRSEMEKHGGADASDRAKAQAAASAFSAVLADLERAIGPESSRALLRTIHPLRAALNTLAMTAGRDPAAESAAAGRAMDADARASVFRAFGSGMGGTLESLDSMEARGVDPETIEKQRKWRKEAQAQREAHRQELERRRG